MQEFVVQSFIDFHSSHFSPPTKVFYMPPKLAEHRKPPSNVKEQVLAHFRRTSRPVYPGIVCVEIGWSLERTQEMFDELIVANQLRPLAQHEKQQLKLSDDANVYLMTDSAKNPTKFPATQHVRWSEKQFVAGVLQFKCDHCGATCLNKTDVGLKDGYEPVALLWPTCEDFIARGPRVTYLTINSSLNQVEQVIHDMLVKKPT